MTDRDELRDLALQVLIIALPNDKDILQDEAIPANLRLELYKQTFDFGTYLDECEELFDLIASVGSANPTSRENKLFSQLNKNIRQGWGLGYHTIAQTGSMVQLTDGFKAGVAKLYSRTETKAYRMVDSSWGNNPMAISEWKMFIEYGEAFFLNVMITALYTAELSKVIDHMIEVKNWKKKGQSYYNTYGKLLKYFIKLHNFKEVSASSKMSGQK
jgi:hypothetical protein